MRTLLWVLAAGCGGGVAANGDIDGDRVPLKSGYFVQEDGYFDGGDGLIEVVLTSLDDACAADFQFSEDADGETDAGNLEDLWKEQLPEDFWYASLYLRVGDPSDDQTKEVLDGQSWDDSLTKDSQAFGSVTHYKQHLDQEYFEGGPRVDLSDYADFWYTDGGDLTITGHKIDERLKGSFPTEVADPTDGDTQGTLEFKFSVDRCVEMERYLF